jgi:hypothetical protein
MVTLHKPIIKTPHYADQGDGVVLHRYLDDDFVSRHLQEMQHNLLTGSKGQDWRQQDRFAGYIDATWLRLPAHRTFYMVNCEVACDQPGFPAFNPDKIIAAGFVIRRKDGQGWMQNNGIAQGWQKVADDAGDPQRYRRLLQRKLIRPQIPEPLPSGEETYPLHAKLITRQHSNGHSRKHTLLYGYVPLGGSVQADIVEQRNARDYFVDSLPWPFGDELSEGGHAVVWQQGDGHLLVNGKANDALNGLMHQLIGRYQLLESDNGSNKALSALLNTVYFYQVPQQLRYQQTRELLLQLALECVKTHPQLLALNNPAMNAVLQRLSASKATLPLLLYPSFAQPDDFLSSSLQSPIDPLLRWLAGVEHEIHSLHGLLNQTPLAGTSARQEMAQIMNRLRRATGSLRALQLYLQQPDNFRRQSLLAYLTEQSDRLANTITIEEDAVDFFAGISTDRHLFISEQQALELREQLFLRSIALTKEYVDSIKIPRYQQNKNDIYYLQPFIRYRDDQGCEQICWSKVVSEPFRVAAPFDPEASRPQSIQMPTLSDLKRGLAKGATFMTPKDLADKLKKMTKDIPPEEKDGSGLGLEWIISFSIPVVTICAMILLMIIVNLLNLFFQWLPYAITFIPKPK